MVDKRDEAEHYLSVRVGSQWYGINVSQVIEVLRLVAFTDFPGLHTDVLGLITLRDQVMPLVDLRRHLGLCDASIDLDTPIVAIREAGGPIALLVDDADRVEEIHAAQILAPHEARQLSLIRAVARVQNRLLFLLDTARIDNSALFQTNTRSQEMD